MKQYRLCFLGFGNVGRALARLFVAKSAELREKHEIDWKITGVATRQMGWRSREAGFEVKDLLAIGSEEYETKNDVREWLASSSPDVVFETTSLNPKDGQPAIDYMRAALEAGAHVVTANKAPIVYAYNELNALAISKGKRFLFESTVLDSAPVFSLFRETLPVTKLRGFSGIFNSTTNVILETMEAGRTFEEGVKFAQELGVAETDPTNDVEGWDAIMKVCALANVVLKAQLLPTNVRREGIRALNPAMLQQARNEGKPYKLLARAKVKEDGTIEASVRPEQVALSEPFGGVRGTSLAVHFELDMIPGLTVISHRPNLQSTAYGLLADFVNIVRQAK
jgi:homoserine dehydrogenase